MQSSSARNTWETALGELELQISKPNYRTFFEKTKGLSYESNEFKVGVPNIFIAEYLDKNQRSLIERTLINLLDRDVRVTFTVSAAEAALPEKGVTKGAAVPSGDLKLNPKYTFDSFVVGEFNRLAHAAAIEVSKNPGRTYNPLFIYGGTGLGKTHLLQAIGHTSFDENRQVIYVSGEEFTNEFVTAVQGRRMDTFRAYYRSTDVLLIDDIQFISGKEQTEECFFHTFNELHNGSKQIVMTCDKPPREVPVLSERLRSRFSWGLAAGILTPDTETRRQILKLKAEKEGASLSPDILDLIATQLKQSIRELEGSLNRLIAYARLIQDSPTREQALAVLRDTRFRSGQSGVFTPPQVIEAVAASFGLSPDDLIGRKRDKEIALAREVAIYLLRRGNTYPLSEIGRSLGGRSPSTVSHAYSKIENAIPSSPYLEQKVATIKDILNPGK